MNNPLLIVAATVLIGSLFYNGILKFKVNGLQDEVSVLELKLTEEVMNNKSLKSAIKTQNDRITKNALELEAKTKELEEWQSQPVEVRYNTIYKNIPVNVDIRGEDCETTKSAIDAVRAINFNNI